MYKKRRQHSPDLKAKVGLEALKGIEPVHAIAAKHQVHPVHPVQVSQWKKEVAERLPEVFARKADGEATKQELIRMLTEDDTMKSLLQTLLQEVLEAEMDNRSISRLKPTQIRVGKEPSSPTREPSPSHPRIRQQGRAGQLPRRAQRTQLIAVFLFLALDVRDALTISRHHGINPRRNVRARRPHRRGLAEQTRDRRGFSFQAVNRFRPLRA